MTSTATKKSTIEAVDSWENHRKRLNVQQRITDVYEQDGLASDVLDIGSFRRSLKIVDDDGNKMQITSLEDELEERYRNKLTQKAKITEYKKEKKGKKRRKRVEELYANPGIQEETVHGMMVSLVLVVCDSLYFNPIQDIPLKSHLNYSSHLDRRWIYRISNARIRIQSTYIRKNRRCPACCQWLQTFLSWNRFEMD